MTAHSDRWHILYIDDDEDDFLITRDLLARAQGRKIVLDWVSSYETGAQKLAEVQARPIQPGGPNGHYDAVLVDYDLGIHTGIELIRQFSPGAHAPLILYTGRGTHEVDIEAMEAGATLYISKTEVNPLLLERVIRYAIELKEKENDLRRANQRLERELAEREKAEEALGKSEEKFAKSFRSSPIAIAISRVSDGTFIEVNDSYLQLFGFTRDELIGHTSIELGLFPDPAERKEVVRRFLATGGFHDYPIVLRSKNGDLLDLLFATERIELEGVECMLSLVVDNTARKRASDAQQASEERLRQFIESTHDNFITLDREWRFTYANTHYCQLMGRSLADLTGQNYWDVFPKYLGTDIERNYRQVMETGVAVHYRYSGGYTGRAYDVSVYPTHEGIAIFSIDRTDEERKEQALEKGRALQDAVLDAMPTAVWIADADGKLLTKNRAADEIWGGDTPLPDTIEGYNQFTAWFADTGKPVAPDEWPLAQALRTCQPGQPVELRIRRFDGGERMLIALASPLLDEQGKLYGAVQIDIDVTAQKQVEQALRLSEEQFRSVLENSVDVAYRRDLIADRYDYLSPVVEQILGYTVEEMMGMSIDEALAHIHPDDQADVTTQLIHAVDSGSGRLVYRFRCKDGSYRWLADNVTVTKDARGVPIYRTGILRDISDRIEGEQALQAGEEKLQLALDAAQMGTWELDPVNDLIQFGEHAQQLYGVGPGWHPRGVLRGRLSHEEDLPGLNAAFEKATDPTGSGRYQTRYRVHKADGTWRWISAWGQMQFSGEGADRRPVRMIGASRDVTEQVEAELALEVERHKLERSNQALTDFAFIASHDLQEPLRKVQAFGNLLAQRYTDQVGVEGKNYIDRISSAAARMSEMIEGLLNYSRITTQGRPFVKVNLAQVARDVLIDLEVRVNDTGGQVELGNLPALQADPLQMRQLLQNLIGNALKYHRPDVPPVVSVRGEIDGAQMRLVVRDNGIGIQPGDVRRLFQPFVRLHSRAEFEGTGMGLAICQKIAERHGGKITVESVPGEGSVFIVTLPVKHQDHD